MASKLWGKLGESVSTDLEAEFPGLDLDLYDTNSGYILSKIALPKEERGFGIGTQVMQRLVDIADSEGKMIALTPDTAFGGSKGRLINFYKRFGFVANKGRNKTFDFRETMVRYPQQDINEAFDSPYPFDWSGNPNDHYEATAEIPTSDGDYDLLYVVFDRDEPGFFDISFLRNTEHAATGKGDEFRIFATVIEAIKQWWDDVDRDKVKEIVFSASKNPEDSSRRHVLYARFAKQFANQIGFDLEVLNRAGSTIFLLKREDDRGFNEGSEGSYLLQLERDGDLLVLHIKHSKTGKRTEVRGKPDYEGDGYDANDPLHQLLDKIGKAASISDLMNGEPVTINPNHPQGASAKAHAGKAFNEASDISKSSQVFVDMDGVLADFFGSWKKLVGKDWREIDAKDIPAALQKIRDTKNFWLKIPPTPNAGKLLGLIKNLKGSYNILSAPLPDDPNSEPHKRAWIEKYLKVFPPSRVIITHDKEKYATQSDGTPNILIDDFGQNLDKWNAAGGIGVKHKDHKFERTFKELMNHLKKDEKQTENFADNKVNYTMPKLHKEWDEASRYPEFRKIGKDAWIKLASKGKAVTITSAKGINNTDATEPDSFSSLDKEKQARTLAQLKSNRVEMPIVAVYSDGYKELIGGNTRLTALMAQRGKATVWQFDVPDDVAELAENFADGKVKGKSRPGRVKRAGASCKGSVTDLRAKAKKYSGERAKMYHWCANMKSGRK